VNGGTLTFTAETWRWLAIASETVSALAVAFLLFRPRTGLFHIQQGKYVDWLTVRLRRLHVFMKAARIADAQLAALVAILTMTSSRVLPPGNALALAIAVAVLPALFIARRVQQRIDRLDAQADAFCLALANALKSTASIGAALEATASLVEAPTSQEITLAIKETKMGRPLGEALEASGPRAGSPKLATVLGAILIGRQVGGNLPKVLETTASTLREMGRLEGVVRQKTADGRMQMWGMSLLPVVLIAGIYYVKPDFFAPLSASATGIAITVAGVASYLTAVVAARKILQVDI
jgi:tight adherence protein B